MDIVNVIKADRDISVSKDIASNAAVIPSATVAEDSQGANRKTTSVADSPRSRTDSNATQAQAKSYAGVKGYAQQNQDSASAVKAQDSSALEEAVKARHDAYFDAIEEERKASEDLNRAAKEKEALAEAKELIASLNQKQLALRFDTDEDFEDARIINVIDAASDEVIRQIPSEEFLRIQATIKEYEQRMAHDDMMTTPSLKSKGLTTAHDTESLRGSVLDEIA